MIEIKVSMDRLEGKLIGFLHFSPLTTSGRAHPSRLEGCSDQSIMVPFGSHQSRLLAVNRCVLLFKGVNL